MYQQNEADFIICSACAIPISLSCVCNGSDGRNLRQEENNSEKMFQRIKKLSAVDGVILSNGF